jgi:hypothetical protein
MEANDWKAEFRRTYDRGAAEWKQGKRTPQKMFSGEEVAFLASLGCTPQELFDFVDDFQCYGEPDAATALAVQAVRRDYFLNVLGGASSGQVASMNDLPAKNATVDGIAWLPRLIEKARLKLRGEMPPDLMYGCGGDRAFLQKVNLSPGEFLQLTRDAGADDRRIVDAVKRSAGWA